MSTNPSLETARTHLALQRLASSGTTPAIGISSLDTAKRGHHPDSPSSLQSSDACPGFENEQRESEAANAGTLQHKAHELRDLSILNGDEAMMLAVTKAIEYEDAVLAQFRLSGDSVEVVKEVYLCVGDDLVTDEAGAKWQGVTGGYPDILIVGRRRGAILDDKYGQVPVTPAKDNLQGISYALGAFRLYPQLEEIEVHFYAPYQGWSPEEQRKLYVHIFHRREIPALELRVRTVVARKHRVYQEIKGGNWSGCRAKHDLCIWCARKADCPKVADIIAVSVSKYHDLVVPEEVKEYRLDTPDRVASAYKFANQLATICEAVKKRCVDAAVTEGLKPDGYSIVRTARRQVTNVRKFVELAIDQGLAEDEAIELLNVPITEFEKRIKEKAAKGQGAAKLREFSASLEEAGATQLGKPYYFLRESKSPAQRSNDVVDIVAT